MRISKKIYNRFIAGLFAVSLMSLSSSAFSASQLSTDLSALVTQGQSLDNTIGAITLTNATGCTDLAGASGLLRNWVSATEIVYASMTAPITVDVASLSSLNDLSNLSVSIATKIKNLSFSLTSIDAVADQVEYDAMLAAMLRLSTDIGTMAGRIGEMADRILVMADNIGLMADRILVTQQLQNTNVVATQNAILATQQNAVALNDTVNTLVYNSALGSLVVQGNTLATSMSGTTLTSLNMSTELAKIQTQAAAYLAQVNTLYAVMMNDSKIASQYTDGDTLTMAGDLSSINKALAASLSAYSATINKLAPKTSKTILGPATDSMLVLVRDIGMMSDRIMEMVDRIIVMADNIGIMSGRIVTTEQLQQSNFDTTQASLLSASNTTVNVIKSYGL